MLKKGYTVYYNENSKDDNIHLIAVKGKTIDELKADEEWQEKVMMNFQDDDNWVETDGLDEDEEIEGNKNCERCGGKGYTVREVGADCDGGQNEMEKRPCPLCAAVKKEKLDMAGVKPGTKVFMKPGMVVPDTIAPGVIESIEVDENGIGEIFIKFDEDFAKNYGIETFDYEIRKDETIEIIKDELGLGLQGGKKMDKKKEVKEEESDIKKLSPALRSAIKKYLKYGYTWGNEEKLETILKKGEYDSVELTEIMDEEENNAEQSWVDTDDEDQRGAYKTHDKVMDMIVDIQEKIEAKKKDSDKEMKEDIDKMIKDLEEDIKRLDKKGSDSEDDKEIKRIAEDISMIKKEIKYLKKQKRYIKGKAMKLLFTEENFDMIKKAVSEMCKTDFEKIANKEEIFKELEETTNIEQLTKWIKTYYEAEEKLEEMFEMPEDIEEKERLEKELRDGLGQEVEEVEDALKEGDVEEAKEELEDVEEVVEKLDEVEQVEDVAASLLKLHDKAIDKFIQSSKERTENKFYASNEFKEFRIEAIDLLTQALTANKITDVEMDSILDVYEIKPTEEELNIAAAKITVPKPVAPPPPGQKYVWDSENKQWVLVKA